MQRVLQRELKRVIVCGSALHRAVLYTYTLQTALCIRQQQLGESLRE